MPPARLQLRALGSLQLVGYANNPTSESYTVDHQNDTKPCLRAEVITELAFIADERVNDLAEAGQSGVDTPLEVQFNEFMDGGISTMPLHVSCTTLRRLTFSVNTRGKDTRTRQRKVTVEQAAAVLLVTVFIYFSLCWNNVSGKGMILGSKGSCRTDHQKG